MVTKGQRKRSQEGRHCRVDQLVMRRKREELILLPCLVGSQRAGGQK